MPSWIKDLKRGIAKRLLGVVDLGGGGERVDIDLRTAIKATALDVYQRAHLKRYEYACSIIGRDLDIGDFACGTGYGTILMSEMARSVLGVDNDPLVVDSVRRRYANHSRVKFECWDLRVIKLDEELDTIVSFETLEHFDPRDIGAVLSKFHDSLRRGGRLILSTPYKQRPSAAARELGFHQTYEIDEAVLEGMLEEAGFSMDKVLWQSYERPEVTEKSEAPDFVIVEARKK